jgi:hypothetical protein
MLRRSVKNIGVRVRRRKLDAPYPLPTLLARELQERPISEHYSVRGVTAMIRKLKGGQYRLYSKKVDPKTCKRKNLGTFATRAAAEKHERAVQYFKHKG